MGSFMYVPGCFYFYLYLMLKYSGMQVANGKKKNLFEGSQDGY
jgi:hypothetical protein